MDIQKPNYYAIIPANIRYDKKLSPNEKLFYGEITALKKTKKAIAGQITHISQGYMMLRSVQSEDG